MMLRAACAECPNITLNASSPYECRKQCYWEDELIMMQPGMAHFTCYYESDILKTATTYLWYLNDTLLPALTTRDVSINIASGFHTVKCEARIPESVNCTCEAYKTIDVIVVGT